MLQKQAPHRTEFCVQHLSYLVKQKAKEAEAQKPYPTVTARAAAENLLFKQKPSSYVMPEKEPLADDTNGACRPGCSSRWLWGPQGHSLAQPAGSAHGTHIQDAEASTAGGAGHAASEPGVRALRVLAAGEPLAHAGETPHGATVTLLALALVRLLAGLHQLHAGTRLHATNAGLQLLWAGPEGHQQCGRAALWGHPHPLPPGPPAPREPGLWESTYPARPSPGCWEPSRLD